MTRRAVLVGLAVLVLSAVPALVGCRVVIRQGNPRKTAETNVATRSSPAKESWPPQTWHGSTPAWRMRALPSVTPLLTQRPTATTSPSAVPTFTATPGHIIYIVQRGDSLELIAERHGLTVVALMAANDLGHPTHIAVGDRLVIPRITVGPKPGDFSPSPTVAAHAWPAEAPLCLARSGSGSHPFSVQRSPHTL
ncbi:MAG TPA: LysM domain-containing protein [Anaerolineae bacterium]|nr:LysM domain-containing protein [Anaerolineae bacterium]